MKKDTRSLTLYQILFGILVLVVAVAIIYLTIK